LVSRLEGRIDGRPATYLPANTWMRGVPYRQAAQVRLYFRQDYLLPGFLVSLASFGFLVVAVARRGRRRRPRSPSLRLPAAGRAGAGGKPRSKRIQNPLPRVGGLLPGSSCASCFGVRRGAGVCRPAGLRRNLRSAAVPGPEFGVDAMVQFQVGDALLRQHAINEAAPHSSKPCAWPSMGARLTEYSDARQLGTLASAYAATGCYEKARDIGQQSTRDRLGVRPRVVRERAARDGRFLRCRKKGASGVIANDPIARGCLGMRLGLQAGPKA